MEKDYFMVIVWCLILNCNNKFLILGMGWIFDDWKRQLWLRRSAGWYPQESHLESEDIQSVAIAKKKKNNAFWTVEPISYNKQDVEIKERKQIYSAYRKQKKTLREKRPNK